MKKTYIVDAVRTPITKGDATGALYEVFPDQLLGSCLGALLDRNDDIVATVRDVMVGCNISYPGFDQNLTKSVLGQFLPSCNISGLQINRGKLSSVDSIRLAANEAVIRDGFWIAGGVESHSYYKPQYRRNAGIDDAIISMHWQADLLATIQGIQIQDIRHYGDQMYQHYQQEISSEQPMRIAVKDPSGLIIIDADETNVGQEWNDPDRLHNALQPLGALEAALINYFPNLESINAYHTVLDMYRPGDGAAMAIIGNEESIKAFDVSPLAEIKSIKLATSPHYAIWEGTIQAMEEALAEAGVGSHQIDQWQCLDQYHAFGFYFQHHFEVANEQWNSSFQSTFFPIPDGAVGAVALIQLIQSLQRKDQQLGALLIPDKWGMSMAVIIECC